MASDYDRVAKAIEFVTKRVTDQPTLKQVADVVGLSPHHFQRLFRRWAGVSPKQFLQQVTVNRAQALLRDSATVLDASLASGLSGPGRLHDHFITLEGMTPGDCRSGGQGLRITSGYDETPFGKALIARTDRGICWLSFTGDESTLSEQWPRARFDEGDRVGGDLFDGTRASTLLHVRGTNFQLRVWRALLTISPGDVTTYSRVATAIGLDRRHARAVGRAVGANPVGYLIPCHRVIQESGGLGGYRWGVTRKQAVLGWESSRLPDVSASGGGSRSTVPGTAE